MKRILFGLLAAAVVAFGLNLSSASASTINVDPSPTDSFNVSAFYGASGANDKGYTFTLTHNADMTFTENLKVNLNYVLSIFDETNNALFSGFNNLSAGTLYTLHVTSFSGSGLSGLDGTATFTAAVTPIPSALLLFITAFGGLGVLGYRRRSLPTA